MAQLAAVRTATVVDEMGTFLGGDGGSGTWGTWGGDGCGIETRRAKGRGKVGRGRGRVGGGEVGVNATCHGGSFLEGVDVVDSEVELDVGLEAVDVTIGPLGGGEVVDEEGDFTKGVGVGDGRGGLGDGAEAFTGDDVVVEGGEGCGEAGLESFEGGKGGLVHGPVEGGIREVRAGCGNLLQLGHRPVGDEVGDGEEPTNDVGVAAVPAGKERGLGHGLVAAAENRVVDEVSVSSEVDDIVLWCGNDVDAVSHCPYENQVT